MGHDLACPESVAYCHPRKRDATRHRWALEHATVPATARRSLRSPAWIVTTILATFWYRNLLPRDGNAQLRTRRSSRPRGGCGRLRRLTEIPCSKDFETTWRRSSLEWSKRKRVAACSQNREFHVSHSGVCTSDRESAKAGTIDIGLPRKLPEPHPENSDIRFHLHQARP